MAIKDMTDQQIVDALQTTPSGATRNALEIELANRVMTQKKAQFLPIVQQELGWTDFTVELGDGFVVIREVPVKNIASQGHSHSCVRPQHSKPMDSLT